LPEKDGAFRFPERRGGSRSWKASLWTRGGGWSSFNATTPNTFFSSGFNRIPSWPALSPLLPPAQNRQQSHEKKDLLAFSSGVAGLRDRPLLSASVRRRPEHQPRSWPGPHHNGAHRAADAADHRALSCALYSCHGDLLYAHRRRAVLHPNGHRRATNAAEHRSYQSGPLYDAVRHAARF